MKNFFTLIFASLFVMGAMAADHRPMVTVKAKRNFEVVIDGKSYFTSSYGYYNDGVINIPYLRDGFHTVKVYSLERSYFFGRHKRMMDAATFVLRNNDINIRIDMFGNIKIREVRFRDWDRDDREWDRNGRDNDWNRDDHDRNRDRRF